MVKLVNRARMTTPTIGIGTLSLGQLVEAFQSFAAAGVADGDVVRYVIEDGSAWEIGTGIYDAAGPTLSRTVSESSNAGVAIPLSGTAQVYLSLTAAEIDDKVASDDPRLDPPTTDEVLAATAGAAAAAIGTYVFGGTSTSGTLALGTVVAGSVLFPGATSSGGTDTRSSSLSGSWRLMGWRATNTARLSLYLRIA
jgi:hypothetical protein